MTITHRIPRSGVRAPNPKSVARYAASAREAELRAEYRAAATEQFPPVTPSAKKAMLDLNRAGLPAGTFETTVRERYGVSVTRFRQIVVRLTTDREAIQGSAGECSRLARIINRPADRRARRRAPLGGAA